MLLCAAAQLLPATADAAEPSAADRETARGLVIEGRRKFDAGDLEGARKAFQAAHDIMGVPTTGLDLARALARLGRLVEARAMALDVARMPVKPKEPEAFTEARPAAATLAEELEKRIPGLEIRVKGPSEAAAIEVRVDGEVVPQASLSFPRKVNPGTHAVEAEAQGFEPARKEITAAEGATIPVELTLAPLPGGVSIGASSSTSPADVSDGPVPLWAWIAGGVGVVALGAGVYFTIDHVGARGDVDEGCPKGACNPEAFTADDVDALHARWNRSLGLAIGLGALGLAGAGVAVVGFTTGRRRSVDTTGFVPWAAPGAVGATYRGAF
ncbi:Hypothetical protein CAP_4466 [Chondromyces apiculatus DSM 436]|uniref:PEGA domain-containing protein n=1 Tax=Chondromyces apiculatus DSM 436 TaxID=1192034 RepID=A0A017T5F9_9BACT|nr:Hypothetical protein CAP_4466 [Chondromyces apiculatus DSM 436]